MTKMIPRLPEGDDGQMTVELCVVFPVVIIIAVILVNALAFFGECAAFDRVCRNAIRANATYVCTETELSDIEGAILSDVKREMDSDSIDCVLSGSVGSKGYLRADITYRYTPTLFGLALRGDVFGVALPQLEHTTCLTVDPYSPGKWLSVLG